MQGSRFDSFTRWTAQRFTRRTVIAHAGAGVAAAVGLAALGTSPAVAQVATPAASPVADASPAEVVTISLLYVQYAGVTTLTPGSGDVHTLTMTEVRPQTVYFSDRPNRIAGAVPTMTFIDGFADAFADSAPNASLVGHLESGGHEEEAVVLTLLSAAYDEAAATLTYEVTLLDAELITDVAFEQEPLTVFDAPREYAEASLFIDTTVVSGISMPGEHCVQFYPASLGCRVFDCVGTGAGACGGQGTNCCDQVCAENGAISQYATFEGCVDTDTTVEPNLSTANWRCECY